MEIAGRAGCAGCARAERERRRREAAEREAAPPAPAAAPGPTQGPPPPTQAPPRGGPVGAHVVATCAYHPGVRAVTRCSACGALVCSGCQRTVGKKRLCEACFNASYVPGRGDQGRGDPASWSREVPARAAVPWKLWPALAFLPLPFILNGLMTYMMRQGDEISVGAAQLLVSLLLYSSTLAFAFIAVSRYGNALAELGVHAGNLPSSLGLGFIGGSLAFWLAVASGLISRGMFGGLAEVEKWLQGFFDVNVKDVTGVDMFIAGIIIIVAAPICEELFFRGYLYPAMRGRLGLWGAVFLNGFLFSVVHFSVFGLIGRTLAGVIFCLLYEYNDNLWSPITAHALNNFVAFFLPLVAIWSS
ncbi:MAG: CPBP family intramembrane metalloprotease [Actinomycetota bacterium]|nr:CPBP family intramembrane metalloprotease [Actinomycetota bacterium]MDD5668134.1 CPBP family intramembrane metalloprotease [Actinomycetota bacterium]